MQGDWTYEEEKENSCWNDSLTQGELYSLASKEYACNAGQDHPDRAWILTHLDVWERNPFYRGPEVPHPEEDYDDEGTVYVRTTSNDDEIPF